jgi:hypothetical protein
VRRLVEEVLTTWPGEWTDGSQNSGAHEATLLSLSIEKAGAVLGWYPSWDFKEAVRRTVQWYHRRHLERASDMLDFSSAQIDDYVQAARSKALSWAGQP